MKTTRTPSWRRVAGAVIVAAIAPTADASVIINGSFEDGPAIGPANFLEISPGATDIVGWVVTRAEIDYLNSDFWQTPDGDRSLDLDGTPGFGGIAQSFATQIGIDYLVEFDMASNPDGAPTIKEMRVEAASQSQDFTYDSTGRSRLDMGWVRREWTFTAVDTTTTLEFYSLDTVNGRFGPALDNVSVTVIPEPSSLITITTIAWLGATPRTRRTA